LAPPSVHSVGEDLLSDDDYPLKKVACEQRRRDGAVQAQARGA